jgi:PAS domain S-box-containing protein
MRRTVKAIRSLVERPLAANLAMAVVFVLAARLGLLLSHPETRVTLVWPPSGIALAAILLFGYRLWPGIFVGDVVVAILEGHPPLMWAIGPLGNTLAAVVGAWVLQSLADFDPHLRRLKDVLWLALAGGLLGTLISATFGVATLTVTGRIAAEQALGAWLTWWLGDTVGVTVMAPALLVLGTTIAEEGWPSIRRRGLARALLPFTLLVLANVIVFGGVGRLFPRGAGLPVAFAVFPALIWVAMRFGLVGSSVSILITAMIGIAGTALGYGPFSGPAPQQNLGVLWGFVGLTAFTGLALGAAVTERRRAEEELALRRQLWDSLMANTPDLVYFKDAHHGLIRASQAYADAVGLDHQELVGKTAAELWPREAEEIMADERRVLAGDAMIRKEREATTAAGEPRWYLLTKVPIYQNGEVIGFFAIDKDITERKQAEQRLAFQSMLLDQIQDMVTATDLDGRITYVNQAECRALGKPADALIGQSVEIYGEDPEHGATQREIIDTVLAQGQWRGDVVNVTADGRSIVLDSRVQLLRDESGEPIGMLGISSDITQRRQMERQLRQQERLAAVGQLASGIAHDFRNLLTTIILYAGLPLRKRDLPSDLQQDLETIIEEADKATDLVQQILDFSSSAMIERRPLDLKLFVDDVLDVLRRTIPETIRITLDAGPGPYVVRADPGRLQQAVTNLALNARDAMPDGGELRFALSRVRTPATAGPLVADPPGEGDVRAGLDGWVCLTISDTGIGMTEEVQEHLFEPFFTTKDVGEGTGLGLAQVYGIVRQHKGTIDVETAVGKGATFRICLPAYGKEKPAEESTGTSGAIPALRGQGETILLVEDEENVRHAASNMLEAIGYRVLTAAGGREALRLCRSGGHPAPDLVITDVVMPEIGGRELLRRLQETLGDVRGVAITGYPLEDQDVEALRETGFVDVIRKPFEVEELARAVRQGLSR